MASIQEFRCEVCGIVTSNPIHWFIIRCGEVELTVHRWETENRQLGGGSTLLRGSSRPGVHQSLV